MVEAFREKRILAFRNPKITYPTSIQLDPYVAYYEYFGERAIGHENHVCETWRELLRAAELGSRLLDDNECIPLSVYSFGRFGAQGGTVPLNKLGWGWFLP
jgi:hypothetical protein